jgi:energy-coupling factor transporter ATP-binding protein EcfA2
MLPNKIRKLYLPNYQQFQRCVVDFTDRDGRAADRICLIGRNGTGKSTILRILDDLLDSTKLPAGVGVEVECDGQRIFIAAIPSTSGPSHPPNIEAWDMTTHHLESAALLECESLPAMVGHVQRAGATRVQWPSQVPADAAVELLVYSPAEPERTERPGVDASGHPKTTLDEALRLFTPPVPYRQQISNDRVKEMWSVLVYLANRREGDRRTFENLATNLQKTKAQLLAEFDAQNPPVLDALGKLWNRILEPAGLELDVEGAKLPIQLRENLEAHIRVRGSKQRIDYNRLSTGIRNFLFRIGHLFLLYFNRPVERGFVLIDEPENSLFPDFLFELMSVYEEILRDKSGATHTQLFMATHSPIVAAQFEPHERVVLEWNDEAHVTASKGSAPKGDDPNDVLRRDFHLPELMGPEGVKSWHEYLDLRKQVRRASEGDKPALIARALAIAGRYGFEPPSEPAPR